MGGSGARENREHIVEGHRAHVVDGLGRLRAEMRGHGDTVGEVVGEQRTRARRGVAGQRVGGVSAEASVTQGGGECRLVDEIGAGGVHQDRAGADAVESRRIDERLPARGVQGDDVGGAEQLVEVDRFGAALGDHVGRQKGIGREHACAETAQTSGDALADAAEAHDADRGGSELATAPHGPVAGPHAAIAVGDEPERGEHEADGVVGDGIRVRPRGVRHRDAAPQRRVEIDRLGADAVAGHDPEVRRGGQVVVGHRTRARDPPLGGSEQGCELGEPVVGGAPDDLVAGGPGSPDEVEVSVRERPAGREDDSHQAPRVAGAWANHGSSAA
ncbi:hypothetical protein SRABI98_03568 [Microbacterium sp. Bi98]|nr:hypothetical protein SRABI98_03568 [Microbacterium sp. Bi98]